MDDSPHFNRFLRVGSVLLYLSNVVLYVLTGSCYRLQIFYIFIWRIFYSLTLDELCRREDNVETKLILWK